MTASSSTPHDREEWQYGEPLLPPSTGVSRVVVRSSDVVVPEGLQRERTILLGLSAQLCERNVTWPADEPLPGQLALSQTLRCPLVVPVDGGISNVSVFPKLSVGADFLKAGG